MAIVAKGFTGTVNQSDMSNLLAGFGGFGIVGAFNAGQCVATRVAGSRTVSVAPGDLIGPGVFTSITATAQPTPSSANGTGSPRIDMLVLRLDWTTSPGTATLMIVEGGGAPPSLWAMPGTKFDIPIYQLTLQSGASDYAVAGIADKRVWVVDGQMIQLSGGVDPAAAPGRMLFAPDTGLLQIGAIAGRWQYKPWTDTGWVDVAVTVPSGWSGKSVGRKLNGVAEISIQWKRTGGSASGITLDSGLPEGWQPAGFDRTIAGWQDNTAVRVIAWTNRNLTLGPINTSFGAIIRAVLRYSHF
ncbi:MAG TPA: hypothetical protein VIQ11_13015 [Mycobacterium sp.]